MATLLVIDDQDRTLTLCRRVMPEHSWQGPARSWAEARAALEAGEDEIDAVLLDLHFDLPVGELLGLDDPNDQAAVRRARQQQGLHILDALRLRWAELPVLLMTARDEGLEAAADREQAEEYTYFLGDEELDAQSLRAMVRNAVEARQGAERDGPVWWGRSGPMRRIRRRLEVLARGRLPVVLGGPTGTGKSLIARHFIHPRSGRAGRFVAVDLSTIPKDLVAAQLFGAARGAYTGAVTDRKGAFEEADGGTLFLDEIANLSEEAQRMLLTVLQERSLCRLGESRERQVDVKLVVATHEDLGRRVREGSFRADLYMRLNPAATVRLPPLTDRTGDLEGLLQFVVQRLSDEGALRELLPRPGLTSLRAWTRGPLPEPKDGLLVLLFPERSLRELKRHPWPGNLRELALTVENALTLTLAELVGADRGGPLGARPDVIQVRPKLVRDLLRAAGGAVEPWAAEPSVMNGAESSTTTTGREAPASLPAAEAQAPTPATADPRPSPAPASPPPTAPPPGAGPLRAPGLSGDGLWAAVQLQPQGGLNRLAVHVERQYFTALYLQHDGDFSAMAGALLGDPGDGRKVQLRFNQLGLRVRELQRGRGGA
jgi:DNA-binding NtrC family response regulator